MHISSRPVDVAFDASRVEITRLAFEMTLVIFSRPNVEKIGPLECCSTTSSEPDPVYKLSSTNNQKTDRDVVQGATAIIIGKALVIHRQ